MYRLFVFDIDGTLLTSNHHLPESVFSSINKIKSKGCQITLATGRSSQWTGPVLDELQVELPHISSGGSVINNRICNELLFHEPIDSDIVKQMVDIVVCKTKLDMMAYGNSLMATQ